jgi:hypothetical protein
MFFTQLSPHINKQIIANISVVKQLRKSPPMHFDCTYEYIYLLHLRVSDLIYVKLQ